LNAEGVDIDTSPENFCISYIKMVSFYAFPEIFIDTATALTTCFERIFSKRAPLSTGRVCLDTLDTPTPGSATALVLCGITQCYLPPGKGDFPLLSSQRKL